MGLWRHRFLIPAAAAVALGMVAAVLSGAGAWSQTRTIKLVVPFPPGGGIDAVARVMADEIGRTHGPTIVIENHPGAGTVLATEAVMRAKPDGNTLLIVNNTFLVTPHLRKVSYDPLASFQPICRVATTPTVIVVNKASPYRTLADLLSAARARPGELTYGSVFGAVLHIGFAMLQRAADASMTFVPYPGTTPAVSAVLGGHVVSALVDYPAAAGQLQAGTLRALATGSRRRIEWLADVPTVAESGYQDFELELWYGLLAPANTAAETVSQLGGLFRARLQGPEIRSRLLAQGVAANAICAAGFRAYLRKQYMEYGRAITEANIKAE